MTGQVLKMMATKPDAVLLEVALTTVGPRPIAGLEVVLGRPCNLLQHAEITVRKFEDLGGLTLHVFSPL